MTHQQTLLLNLLRAFFNKQHVFLTYKDKKIEIDLSDLPPHTIHPRTIIEEVMIVGEDNETRAERFMDIAIEKFIPTLSEQEADEYDLFVNNISQEELYKTIVIE